MNKDNEQRERKHRVIKFRAIVPVNSDGPKSMHYFDLSKIDDCNRLSYADYDANALMQFTGLLDKNGKEIYEGDRLKFFDKEVATVVWQDFGGWSYQWTDPTYKTIRQQNPEPFFRNINLFEVIGHIYSSEPIVK